MTDIQTMTQQVLLLALEKQVRLTCAESCTGGLVAAALTDLPGSSAAFEYGFVTYSNHAKTDLLGVRPETLDRFGAVSEQTVREMALGALKRAQADIAVSISGIAGPGGSEFKPEGRVCFGLAHRLSGKDPQVITKTQDFGAPGRAKVRQKASFQALTLLFETLSSI